MGHRWFLVYLALLHATNLYATKEVAIQTLKDRENKIVGGKEVKPSSFPWQVSVQEPTGGTRKGCGGTILCSRFVMSAAHCALDLNLAKVVVGLHNATNEDTAGVTEYKIKIVHRHPQHKQDFTNSQQFFDFAVVELEDPINMTPEARALYLPDTQDDKNFGPETIFVVSGYGVLEHEGPLAENLQSASVSYIPFEVCKKAYSVPKHGKSYRIEMPSMICAGYLTGKVDACQGDSGGPLAWMDPKTGHIKLIGVVSFGHRCAEENAPGVYARISAVLDWINSIIGDCNKEACSQKQCMTKQKMDRETIHTFSHLTREEETGTGMLANRLQPRKKATEKDFLDATNKIIKAHAKLSTLHVQVQVVG